MHIIFWMCFDYLCGAVLGAVGIEFWKTIHVKYVAGPRFSGASAARCAPRGVAAGHSLKEVLAALMDL